MSLWKVSQGLGITYFLTNACPHTVDEGQQLRFNLCVKAESTITVNDNGREKIAYCMHVAMSIYSCYVPHYIYIEVDMIII